MGDGPVDDSVLPAHIAVDWVRVYQTPEHFGAGPDSPYVLNATGGGARQGVLLWGDDFNGTYNGSMVCVRARWGGWDVLNG